MRGRAFAAGPLAAVLLAAAAVSPTWPSAARSGSTSFECSCRLYGDLVFDQPLGNTLRTTTFTDTATGTCSGKLNGVRRDSIPVTNTVTGWGTISCSAGNAHTSDTLLFARRYPIHIFTESAFGLTQGL